MPNYRTSMEERVKFESYETFSGSGMDTYDPTNTFTPARRGARWDILIKNYDVVVSFKDKDNTNWLSDMVMPVGFHSIDFDSTSIQIMNKTAGNDCVFDIIVYY